MHPHCFRLIYAILLLTAGVRLSAQTTYESPPYIFSTIAGNTTFGSVDGVGSAARFSGPYAIVCDKAENVFVLDWAAHVVRKVSRAGVVTTVAGLAGVSGSTDGRGGAARFNYPLGMAIDPDGVLYVSDTQNQTIRRITADGTVSTLAGATGVDASTDGVGAAARLSNPTGITVSPDGNIYVIAGGSIRKITRAGEVSTFLASSSESLSPGGLASDSFGNLYAVDQSRHIVRKISPSGSMTIYAGTLLNDTNGSGSRDGPALTAKFNRPWGVALDADQNLFIADYENSTIRKISRAGSVTTLAGQPPFATGANDGVGSQARFTRPASLTVGPTGRLYIADTYNSEIRLGISTAPLSFTGSGAATLRLDQPFSYAVAFTGYPTAFTAVGLPPGLLFDATTGIISGTPTTQGNYPVTLTATNGGGSGSAIITLTVIRTPVAITIPALSTTYDGTPKSLIVSTDPAGIAVELSYNGSKLAPVNAGTYSVVATSADPNFQGSASATLTIARRTLTVSADAKTRPHGDANPPLTWTYSGFAPGDSADLLTGAPLLATSATAASPPGAYPITLTAGTLNAANYVFAPIPSTLTVAAIVPRVLAQSTATTVSLGGNADLFVSAVGSDSLGYQWRFNGAAIPGATLSSLRIANVTTADAGAYTVVVTNTVGTAVSSPITLAVTSPVLITAQPATRTASLGERIEFSVTAIADNASAALAYQWRRDGVNLPGATTATLVLSNVTATDFGTYTVHITSPAGSVTSAAATLGRTGQSAVAPVIVRQPLSVTINPGSTLALSATAIGSPEPSYQWARDGNPISGATGPVLVLTDIVAAQAGAYVVRATNVAGTAVSTPAVITVAPGLGRQINVSTLGYVGTGGDILIPGFVISGSAEKRLLIRAVGATLEKFGVANILYNPRLAVFHDGTQILQNDDWAWTADAQGHVPVSEAAAAIGAFPLPAGSLDAALVATLPPGGYSVQVSGVGDTTGQSLVEIYDLDPANSARSRLVNLATRALVTAGGGPLISGFVVQGAVAKAVLVRATGPALSGFGVPGVLAQPKLSLFDSSGSLLATNVAWESGNHSEAIIAAGARVGAFSLARGSHDSALLAVLPPGSYTAQVVGADGSGGVTLIEIYELP